MKKTKTRLNRTSRKEGEIGMETLEERILCLEKRISDIEAELKNSREKLQEIVSTWQDVLIDFADDFAIDSERIEKLKSERKMREI